MHACNPLPCTYVHPQFSPHVPSLPNFTISTCTTASSAAESTATMAAVAAAAGLILALAFASSSPPAAAAVKFNVTEILHEFPEFSMFNGLLSQTRLAEDVNLRPAVTVLVVDDAAAGAITSLPEATQGEVVALQVLLDYYDPVKLYSLKAKTALLPTLLRPTAAGGGGGGVGLVKYTEVADDQMAFGSGEPGAPIGSQLVKVVACRPYNLSVMQVSAPIVAPSLGGPSSGGGTPPYSPATAKSADDASASSMTDYDDDPIAPAAVDGPGIVDTPPTKTTSPSTNGTSAAADGTTTSAGSCAVVAGAGVGLMAAGLVMLISV